MTYLTCQIKKKKLIKKLSKAITVLQKAEGGPWRYDHDYRFHGFDPFRNDPQVIYYSNFQTL